MANPTYFLISVSTCHHLELCLKYAIAGFTNSPAGAWTFCEINEGDFVSFLYVARIFNLYYEVERKEAIKEFKEAPPWEPVTFRESGHTYYFPFRLYLKPIREFCESLVRPEFSYVAENLLLRAGYWKTHFQADQTTLQNVSQMGRTWKGDIQPLVISNHSTFEPLFTPIKQLQCIPLVCPFQETILQAAIRQHLSDPQNLAAFLSMLGLNWNADDLEVLGEKALSEGHVDILIKDRVPIAQARKIAVEVKLHKAQLKDLTQLRGYMDELGEECVCGILIAETFSRSVIQDAEKQGIQLIHYELALDWHSPKSFSEILDSIKLRSASSLGCNFREQNQKSNR